MKWWFAICLLLTACGSKPQRPQVRLGVLGAGLQTQQMHVTLAKTLGFYEQEGVDVTLENLGTNSKTLQSLVGGSVDVASISYSQSIQMAAQGQHIRTFFIGVNRNSVFLLVTLKGLGRIHRIEDLKGAVMGVPSLGSPTHQWINAALIRHGVQPADVKSVAIGTGAPSIAAFESGRIDAAAVGGGDHLRLLKRNPSARILVDTSTAEGSLACCGANSSATGTLAAKQGWLDREPETARRLDRALVRSLKWIATHSAEEIYARLPENLRSPDAVMDIEVVRWSLPQFTSDGKMPRGAPEAMKRFLDASVDSVREAKIDLAATWTNEYLPGAK
jgi:NitT/TauT family transport system substrate-binding protein